MLESNIKNNKTFELFEKVVSDSSKDIRTLYGLKTNFEFIEQNPKQIGEPEPAEEKRFDDLDEAGDDDWESLPIKKKGKAEPVKKAKVEKAKEIAPTGQKSSVFDVSSVSWGPNGSTLAVGYAK